ncbi:MAG: putative Rossmann-fold nucleotide-binding protein, partial [Kiritimatiellia bacterium]
GFGTMDELFETLTLVQTGKIKRDLPLILFGTKYWDGVLKMEEMADMGTISRTDPDLLFRTDSVDEAFEHLVGRLEALER